VWDARLSVAARNRSFVRYTVEDNISRPLLVTFTPDQRVRVIKLVPLQRFNNPKVQYIRKTALYISFPLYNAKIASTHAASHAEY
jgi:hypothetical protein